MAINPKRVAIQVALRAQQLDGEDQAGLETNYNASIAGTAVLDGSDAPMSAIVDTVLMVEAELAEIIANDSANPYRKLLAGRSEDLAHGDDLPTTDEDGSRFIGVYTGVNDSEDDMPLTKVTIQEIARFRAASPSRYTTRIRKYEIFNGKIYHTRTNVYIDGCVWNRNSARNRFNTSSTQLSPLPTSLEATWIARSLELLASEQWFLAEGQYYAGVAATGIAKLKARSLDLPTLPSQEQVTKASA